MGTEGVGRDFLPDGAWPYEERKEGEREVKDGTIQVPSGEAAGLVLKICALYVMPHYKEEFEVGSAGVEAEPDDDEKLVKAKVVLANCVFNFHVNMAIRALVEEKEREKNSTGHGGGSSGSPDGNGVRE